ncbi:hypothetical protein N7517_009978 [Penicillium concentricum]|uniref:Uncharacterized protein n=1 Tax=Penicillium concentricum TaxID=293559 RepID=A0A9W9RI93_9EURO|nr:uncharacterized protein N7517_009978 [Penicillium concentricum]KAJ5360787.1 hypothetical protein N7517_009978 [Penicillium concentricum]
MNHRNQYDQAVALEADSDLFDLIQRIHSLHCNTNGELNLSPLRISDAVHIWQDLDDWDSVGTDLINEDDNLHESYKFALFIWAYIIVHPAEVGGEKVQDTLHYAMSNISEVEAPDLVPLVIIPLFFSGLVAIRQSDRDLVNEQYERVESHTEHGSVKCSRHIVRLSWENHDNGMERSWDWRRWRDSSSADS